ncbi:hypothetical protein ACPPVU_13090 [Mucilaginibacter sp. McL0603]|uniref:hypothetical protein n=1 Tax=Mucilaginibacter sp. McL0603 TaxID=3415670 RepID=UPI003CEFDC12
MKTQCINLDQTFLNITNLIITGVKSFNLNKLFSAPKFSTDKIGYYLLPLIKQLFRDNFMGSDAEMGVLLIFLKGYFSSAVETVRSNAVGDLFRKLRGTKDTVAVLDTERIYDQQQAA